VNGELESNGAVSLSRQELIWWAGIILLIGGLLGAGLVHLLQPARPGGAVPRTAPLPVLGQVSDFSLIDSAGEPVSRDDLGGGFGWRISSSRRALGFAP
jgi:cytochrome oxidase Cu insertion factor (SCO1/SenC/PrrC family)